MTERAVKMHTENHQICPYRQFIRTKHLIWAPQHPSQVFWPEHDLIHAAFGCWGHSVLQATLSVCILYSCTGFGWHRGKGDIQGQSFKSYANGEESWAAIESLMIKNCWDHTKIQADLLLSHLNFTKNNPEGWAIILVRVFSWRSKSYLAMGVITIV